jgi:hypothetical protein
VYLDAQSLFSLGDALASPFPPLPDFPGDWPEISEFPEISDWLHPDTLPVERPDDTCYLSLSARWDIHALLDRQDYEWAKRHTWCHTYGSGKYLTLPNGVRVIERPNHIYARTTIDGVTVWLHRLVLGRAAGPPRYVRALGDHLNGRTLDCRRKNLRWATHRMNSRNKPGTRIRRRLSKISE